MGAALVKPMGRESIEAVRMAAESSSYVIDETTLYGEAQPCSWLVTVPQSSPESHGSNSSLGLGLVAAGETDVHAAREHHHAVCHSHVDSTHHGVEAGLLKLSFIRYAAMMQNKFIITGSRLTVH